MAGEVVEVGHGVKDYKPGDKVVAMLNPRVSHRFHILFSQGPTAFYFDLQFVMFLY